MDLNDLIKLAGIQNAQAPVQEEPVVSSSDGMRTMIALVTPEQLNQLTGDAPVAEEMPGEATTEPNPQEYEGTLGSPADLSLRRYLGANGEHVTVDETKVYEDHKVEDITEAWNAYKADPVSVAEAKCSCESHEDHDSCADDCDCNESVTEDEAVAEAPYQYDMSDKGDMHDALGDVQNSMDDAVNSIQKAAGLARQVSDEIENSLYTDESVEEADVEENAFNQAAAAAARANKPEFEFGGKKYKTKMSKDTAHKLDDDIDVLKQLAGL